MPTKPPTHDPHPGQPKTCNVKVGGRFYKLARWKRVRRMVLSRQPLCVDPLSRHVGRPVAATEVDHVVPRLDAPDLAYSLENLRGVCKPCHAAISMRARHAKARRAR